MNTLDLTDLVRVFADQTRRLERTVSKLDGLPAATAIRYAVRKLDAKLDAIGVASVDLTGQRFDEGLAVEVAEVVGVDAGAGFRILAMPKPILLWNEVVLQRGEVVLEPLPAPLGRRPKPAWNRALSRRRRRRGRRCRPTTLVAKLEH